MNDIFDEVSEAGDFTRDRWGRPVIGGVTYARVSTVSEQANPGHGLCYFRERTRLLALARSPELTSVAQQLTLEDKDRLKSLSDTLDGRAEGDVSLDPRGKTVAAARGTALHVATDFRRAAPADSVLSMARQGFAAGLTAARWDIIATEYPVWSSDLRVAGTLDHVIRHIDTGETRVLDKKSCTSDSYIPWGKFSIQTALYAACYGGDVNRECATIALIDRDTGGVSFVDIPIDMDDARAAARLYWASLRSSGKGAGRRPWN